MDWVGALSFIVRFCGGQTDLNNNQIPDNKEIIDKMKIYLDTLKVKNEGARKKKENMMSKKLLKKILK
jgi:hypothetical protein